MLVGRRRCGTVSQQRLRQLLDFITIAALQPPVGRDSSGWGVSWGPLSRM